MWKKGRMLAACMFAAAWWSVFYPELCFTEETCQVVQNAETEKTAGQPAIAQSGTEDAVSGILGAGDGEVVISSRLLEWCEERLFDRKE